jgi:hypothetical protein
LEFNRQIIQATEKYSSDIKSTQPFMNLQEQGLVGNGKTFDLIPSTHFKIADAKRPYQNTSLYTELSLIT